MSRQAHEYRAKANEAILQAHQATPDMKEALLEIARGYDHLAQLVQRTHRTVSSSRGASEPTADN